MYTHMKLTLSSKNKENQRKMSTANNVTEYTSKITVNQTIPKSMDIFIVRTALTIHSFPGSRSFHPLATHLSVPSYVD